MREAIAATVVDWAQDLVETGGYAGLAGAILIENIFPPIPSEVVLPLAGFFVDQGDLMFVWAVLAATLGSVLGALLLYGIARHGGRPLVLRHGKLLRVTDEDLDKADDWFDRYGSWLVVGGRVFPGVRSIVSIPAGLSEMPVVRFTALTALGSAVWNTALIGAGWALGDNYEQVADVLGPAGTVIVIVVFVAVVAAGAWWYRSRRDASDG